MTVKDWFTQPNANFVATPVVFKLKDKDVVAATTADGRIFVLDAAALGGGDHRTPLTHASRRATRARIRQIIGGFAGEAGLLGACSCFSDTLLES